MTDIPLPYGEDAEDAVDITCALAECYIPEDDCPEGTSVDDWAADMENDNAFNLAMEFFDLIRRARAVTKAN